MQHDQYLIDFESDKRERLALVRCLERVAVNMPGGRWACVVELLERLLILSTDTRPDANGRILTRCQVCVIGSAIQGRRIRDRRSVQRWCADAASLGLLEVVHTSLLTGGPSWNEYRIVWPMVRAMLSPTWQPASIDNQPTQPILSNFRVDTGGHEREKSREPKPPSLTMFRVDTGGHGWTRVDTMSTPNKAKNTYTPNSNFKTNSSSSSSLQTHARAAHRLGETREPADDERQEEEEFGFGFSSEGKLDRSAPLGSIDDRGALARDRGTLTAPLGSPAAELSDRERLSSLVSACGEAGVYDADRVVPAAVDRVGIAHVEAILAHFRGNPGAWHGGGLRLRLTRCRPWTAPESGWPPAMRTNASCAVVFQPKPRKSIDEQRRELAAAREEARRVAAESEDLGAQFRAAMEAKRGGR